MNSDFSSHPVEASRRCHTRRRGAIVKRFLVERVLIVLYVLVVAVVLLALSGWGGCAAVKDAELTGLRAEIAAVKTVVHDNSTRNYDEWTLRADALGRLIRDGLFYLGIALPGAYIGGKLIWLLVAKGLGALNGFWAKPRQPP